MTRLIAHRGFADVNPENTLTAVRNAATVADGVEVDVRRCGSGELVIIHDETVDRVSEISGRVADLSLADLRALDVLGCGEGVPTLEAVIDAVPDDVLVNVELKEEGLVAAVAELVAGHGNEVLISSFLTTALAAAREVAPDVPRAMLFADAPAEHRRSARELGCAALHPRHDLCSEQFVTAAQAAGFAVNAWTIRDARTARRLQDVGVDGLIADDPAVCAPRSPQVNEGRDTDANNGI